MNSLPADFIFLPWSDLGQFLPRGGIYLVFPEYDFDKPKNSSMMKESVEAMKTLFLRLSVLFAVLTIAGSIYVMLTAGQASAGFAVLPMIGMFAFLLAHRWYQPKNDHE